MTDDNPYAPPVAPIGELPVEARGDPVKAVAVRRKYLRHEQSIKSIGGLHYLAVLPCLAVVTAAVLYRGLSPDGRRGGSADVALLAVIGFYLGLGASNGVLGFGLRRFKPLARWVEVGIASLACLGLFIATLAELTFLSLLPGNVGPRINILIGYGIVGSALGFALFVLLGKKSTVIFSTDYQDVIALTPDIKHQTGDLAWGCFFIVVVIPVIATIIGAIGRVWL